MPCDILSTDDHIFNFEIKTTTSPREIYGNRVVSQAKSSGSFLLAVNYNKITLDVTRVRFGWVDPTCWAGQAGNGQQARLTAVARDTRLQDCTGLSRAPSFRTPESASLRKMSHVKLATPKIDFSSAYLPLLRRLPNSWDAMDVKALLTIAEVGI